MKKEIKITLLDSFTENIDNFGERPEGAKIRKYDGTIEYLEPVVTLKGIFLKGKAVLSNGEEVGDIEFHAPLTIAIVRMFLKLKADEILGLVQATESME